jgi:hypothetical protein
MRYRPDFESLEDRRLLSKSSLTHEFLEKAVDDKKPLAVHIQSSVQIIIDGQAAPIAAGIGVVGKGKLAIHTDDDSGKLDIESTTAVSFHLSDFFTIWSDTPQGAQTVHLLETARFSLVTVNGVPTKDLDDVDLDDHDAIVVQAISSQPSPQANQNQVFVTHLYRDLLQRAPDQPGLVGYTTELDRGMSHTQLVQVFVNSDEYHMRAVQQLYQTILHRAADAPGLAGFVSFLDAGGSLNDVRAQLLASTEFYNNAGGTNAGFLIALYTDVLHRGLDANGDQAWGASLAAGTDRMTIAESVMNSPEWEQDLINNYYHTVLHRNVDADGLAGFVGAMQQGMREDQVVVAMASSAEYFGAV